MAILIIEGFDTAQASKFGTKGGWNSALGSVGAGRFGGFSGRCNTSNRPAKAIPNSTTLIVGFAFKVDTTANLSNILRLMNGTQAVGSLAFETTGRLRVTGCYPSEATVVSGTTVLSINVWHYIEFKLVVGASGTCETRVNGGGDIPSTVGNFGTQPVNSVWLYNNASGNQDFDDLYVLDTTGPAPRNTWLGDVRVATLFPSGAGATTQWTPNTGANYAAVDEKATTYPDDDTTYVSDSTPGHIDTYTFDDLPGTAFNVYGVQTNVYARKDDAGTRTIAPVIRKSSTDYPGTAQAVASSYAYASEIFQQDPTAADWTIANVNAAEFGIKLVA